jgi:hypothetical protein
MKRASNKENWWKTSIEEPILAAREDETEITWRNESQILNKIGIFQFGVETVSSNCAVDGLGLLLRCPICKQPRRHRLQR